MLKRGFQFAPGYRLQEFLGRGQFGQVWRATAPGGAATAAKFIDLSDGQGQKEYEGVRRVKQIRHANLMPITAIWLLDGEGNVIEEAPEDAIETIDLGSASDVEMSLHRGGVEPSWLVVAMLLGGKSLQARLRECVDEGLPGIPPKELISYMDEAAKGIDFLNKPQHDLGDGPIAIQHSDIKPANIVLIGSSAVVCDFGLARILTRNQVTATSASGTPAYMAPEAIKGKPARTSDQYSLAVTYYHLRTGTLPMEDSSLWEVLEAHRDGNLKFGRVPEAENHVLKKATDLDWEQRFDSCLEFVDALREALRVEGHTKPSFVPPSLNLGPVNAEVNEGDPTATLEIPSDSDSAPVGLHSRTTRPVVAVDQSTKKDGLQSKTVRSETIRDWDDAIALSPSAVTSPMDWLRKNRYVVGGLSGAVLALVLVIVSINGGDRKTGEEETVDETTSTTEQTEQTGGSTSIVGQPGEGQPGGQPVNEPTFGELYSEAMAKLPSDPKVAGEVFAKALTLEPGWQPSLVRLEGHSDSVMKMVQSSDGHQTISAASGPEPLLWDLRETDRAPVRLLGHETLVNDFAVAGNRLITVGSDPAALVWNLTDFSSESTPLRLQKHSSGIDAVSWRGGDPVAATASSDLTICVWKIGSPSTGNPNGTIEIEKQIFVSNTITSLSSDRDGKYLAAMTVGSDPFTPQPDVLVYRWDDLLEQKGTPEAISLGTKSARLASMLSSRPYVVTGNWGGGVRVYEIQDGSAKLKIQSDKHRGDVEALRVRTVDDYDVIVTGAVDGSVSRWKYGTTSNIASKTFSELGVSSVDVSSDGRYVAAGLNDGTVWLWDTENDDALSNAFRLEVGFSVDSIIIDRERQRLIAGCEDGVIRIWDLQELILMLLANPTPATSDKFDREIKIDTKPIT